MLLVGDRIRKIREEREYSQEYVAEQLGISQNAYSKIEINQTQNFTLERLEKLAQIFEVSIADILGVERSLHIYSNSDQHSDQINNQNQGDINKYESPEVLELLRAELKAMREERNKLLEIIKQLTGK
ncbi:MAG: helix-turn-helix domain-containing protein [Thermonemataceae bacterium]